jgi:hypothetical protein
MTKRNFNWHYNTAHELGRSHVSDQREEEIVRVQMDAASTSRNPRTASHFERQRERHEFFAKNPHLLTNIHA